MAGGYKLFSTGEVLTAANVNNYLMNQTVMVFASAAARTTALSGVLAEGMISYRSDAKVLEIYNGTTWVTESSFVSPLTTKGDVHTYSTTDARLGVGTTNQTLIVDSTQTTGLKWAASPQSTLSAKGSLVSASAANTLAELTVGSDGQTLVANSSQTTGLAYTNNFAAGKNKIINGDFNINQRAFTSATTTGVYTFDRWLTNFVGGTVTYTPQVFTAGTAPVAGYESTNYIQIVTSGQTGTNFAEYHQKIEDVRSCAGKTVTISFWAKAATGTPLMTSYIYQVLGTGGTGGNVQTNATAQTITTSWARYSFTITVPSLSGKTVGTGSYSELGLVVSDGGGDSTGLGAVQNNTFSIWGVQVEQSGVSTAFQTATGTLQGELAACQRYYYRQIPSSGGRQGSGSCQSTTAAEIYFPFFTAMRITPTALEQSGTAADYGVRNQNQNTNCSAVPVYNDASVAGASVFFTVASGLTAGNAALFRASNTSAYLGWSAEL